MTDLQSQPSSWTPRRELALPNELLYKVILLALSESVHSICLSPEDTTWEKNVMETLGHVSLSFKAISSEIACKVFEIPQYMRRDDASLLRSVRQIFIYLSQLGTRLRHPSEWGNVSFQTIDCSTSPFVFGYVLYLNCISLRRHAGRSPRDVFESTHKVALTALAQSETLCKLVLPREMVHRLRASVDAETDLAKHGLILVQSFHELQVNANAMDILRPITATDGTGPIAGVRSLIHNELSRIEESREKYAAALANQPRTVELRMYQLPGVLPALRSIYAIRYEEDDLKTFSSLGNSARPSFLPPSTQKIMLSSALRSQARLSLFRAAAPASRSLSSSSLTRAAVRASASVPRGSIAAVTVQRAFSISARVSQEQDVRSGSEGPAPASTSIYIGNMPWSMNKDELTDLFSEFGEIKSVRIQTHADGRPRGFAHITFADQESAEAVVTSAKEEPIHFSGRDLFVDYARRPTFTHKDEEPNKLVYFGRYDAGEEGLRNLLSEYEESIVTLSFLRNGDTGEQLKSGFVEFSSIETATEVINKFNGQKLEDGVQLRLSYARKKKSGPRQQKPVRKGHYTNRAFNPPPPANDRYRLPGQ
ncbi:hypothetical protein CVT26_012449 [Gymnopilus dilepis]|uniref:RRM domain-containing protein n=1 Tax=Gymnopilus dilepis TaxID=231916 RepID=A0A409YCT1_9AGAR|nr:hypothetical protein CVT26_012449 [Gymnopilus dilepis]